MVLFSLFVSSTFSINVAATSEKENEKNTEETKYEVKSNQGERVEEKLTDKVISRCELLYNLDDSADYIYVEFANEGYAIFSSITMEMMEYSLQGKSPYYSSKDKMYYSGPSNYLIKKGDVFIDVETNDQIEIPINKAMDFAKQSRNLILNKTTYKTKLDLNENELKSEIDLFLNTGVKTDSNSKEDETPVIDTSNLIIPNIESGKLIANYRYFVINPIHGENTGGSYANNNSGTCGPVAAQLLLGYNNYYNDRRIIEDKYLQGYKRETNEVIIPENNPNYCSDPMLMTRRTTGTNSGATGEISYYVKVIESIMEPNTSGCSIDEVAAGIESLLSENLSSSEYTVDYEKKEWFFGYSPISSNTIKSEIDAGRPIIVSMGQNLGATNHDVVAYGYQNYTYPNGEGTYEGYIVHYGGIESSQVWINSSWCDGYVSLKINHTHNYNTVGAIAGTTRTEYKCSICGHRTDAAINMKANDRYSECIVSLPQNEYTYKDIYVTFKRGGNQLFQTFGDKDVKMYLFDDEYNTLAYNDDNGSSTNALFKYNVEVNKPYILRVKFYNKDNTGDIKVGITPADSCNNITNYESIWNETGTSATYPLIMFTGQTTVMTFTPTESGTYTFAMGYVGDVRVDTYLYLVDPHSTSPCLSDDDGGGDLQAKITTNLIANRRYFIVASPYSLYTADPMLILEVEKTS